MKKLMQRIVLLLLAVVLLAGAVPAQAVYVEATAPGDPNPTHRTLTVSETSKLYENSIHVARADTYEWPSGGAVLV